MVGGDDDLHLENLAFGVCLKHGIVDVLHAVKVGPLRLRLQGAVGAIGAIGATRADHAERSRAEVMRGDRSWTEEQSAYAGRGGVRDPVIIPQVCLVVK